MPNISKGHTNRTIKKVMAIGGQAKNILIKSFPDSSFSSFPHFDYFNNLPPFLLFLVRNGKRNYFSTVLGISNSDHRGRSTHVYKHRGEVPFRFLELNFSDFFCIQGMSVCSTYTSFNLASHFNYNSLRTKHQLKYTTFSIFEKKEKNKIRNSIY